MDAGTCGAPSWRDSIWSSCRNGFARPLATLAISLLGAAVLAVILLPYLWSSTGAALGWHLRRKTAGRRAQLLELMNQEEKEYQGNKRARTDGSDDDWETVDSLAAPSIGNGEKAPREWDGIVGFFHPFCNAGGGGERVLWAAIRATQNRWPNAKCVVYTGDHEVNKEAILNRVEDRFNIRLHAPTLQFLYLSTRHWVLPATWPRFTLAGQSIGSVVMAWDALSLLVPDVFVDTMGYVFAQGLCKLLFNDIPTGAYVHYPTISTDMLDSLDPSSAVGTQGVNAGQGVGLRGWAKKNYWKLFAKLYSYSGSSVDVVMTNSSWTQDHIQALWGPLRQKKGRGDIAVVYPPVAVRELEHEVEVSRASEAQREKVILYIAQFRREKNHHLILQSFADFLKTGTPASRGARLMLIGSVRDDADSKRVYKLRLFVNELHVVDQVDFALDASWPDILKWLRRASVGVNGMWNEHFGIGVVEYQAAGLIPVVHDSGGPKLDIVINHGGEPTGFRATTPEEFARGFEKALSQADPLAWRLRNRASATRFTEEEFAKKWVGQMQKLVAMAARP